MLKIDIERLPWNFKVLKDFQVWSVKNPWFRWNWKIRSILRVNSHFKDRSKMTWTLGTKLKCHSETSTSSTLFATWKCLSAGPFWVARVRVILGTILCCWQYYDVNRRISMLTFWDICDHLSLTNRYVSNDHWVLKLCHHYRFLQHLWSASM